MAHKTKSVSQGKILALAWRQRSLKRFEVFPFRSVADRVVSSQQGAGGRRSHHTRGETRSCHVICDRGERAAACISGAYARAALGRSLFRARSLLLSLSLSSSLVLSLCLLFSLVLSLSFCLSLSAGRHVLLTRWSATVEQQHARPLMRAAVERAWHI